MTKKDLGIVICNFNKVDYLRNCLNSIFNANFENLSYDIIVVDNASNDGSEEMVTKEFPNVVLIQTGANLGGAGGFARGMQYVLDNKYKYLSVLDNDTIVDKNAFIELKNYLDKNDDVGVVGSTILKMDEPEIIQEMGAMLDYVNFKFNLNYGDTKYNKHTPNTIDCDYVPACCFMTKYEVLKEVGVFNHSYFIYFDDIEWCTRVKKTGKKIYAIKKSKVWHKGGAKLVTNTFPVYYYYRNLIRFFLTYIEDSLVDSFLDKIGKLLNQVIFFSNLKGNYATPKSMLCAIDDLFIGKLGKQDDSIFTKEPELNIFEKYSLNKNDNIAIYMQEDMISNRRVYLYLKNFYKNISIYCDEKNFDLISANFDEKPLSDKEFLENSFTTIFYIQEHILDFKEDRFFDDRYIFIDLFTNVANLNEIKNLNSQYKMYEDIFKNIYQPVFEKKFRAIRDRFKKEKNI